MRHQGSHVPRIAHPNRLLSSSLFASLVARWRKVLFPGPTPQPASASPRVLALLVVLSSVLLYSCLNFRLFEPDEGRYAEIPREMLARGEWIVPLLQGEPYLDKPPLLYWLVMVSYRLCGVHDWAARLVPALAVQGCILLTYLLGRRVLGLRAAWWGALLLLVAPGLMLMGRLLLLDGLLTLWTTLALFSVFEATRGPRLRWGWWLTAALACALGILTKGPIILVLLVPPLCLYHGLTRGGAPVCWRALLAFTALVVLLPLPWFVAMCGRVPDFAYHFFWQHHVVRYADPFDHQRPIWFFLPILFGSLLPASALMLAFVRFLFSSDPRVSQRRPPELGYVLLAGGWCVLFFSLSGCKLPTYILPALPPLALALGHFIASSRWDQARGTVLAIEWAFSLMLLVNLAVIPWYAHHRSPLSRPNMVARFCGDPAVPIVCYPRPCDSMSFYLGRDDLIHFRSKNTPLLIEYLRQRPRTVVLCTHRHTLRGLRSVLPPDLRVTRARPLFGSADFSREGLCHLAVVERVSAGP